MYTKRLPIIYKLKLLIKSSPLFYKSYLLLRGKYNSELFPSNDTSLHIGGFQRSGNTFCKKLLNILIPSLKLASHVHAVSTLKLSLLKNIPTIVLIRDPENAVSSSIVKSIANGQSREMASIAIIEYVQYYEFVYKYHNFFVILNFSTLKDNPKKFISIVSKILDIKFSDEQSEKAINGAISQIKEKKKTLDDLGIPGDYGWHSDKKEKLKSSELSIIKNRADFKKATEIYNKIIGLGAN